MACQTGSPGRDELDSPHPNPEDIVFYATLALARIAKILNISQSWQDCNQYMLEAVLDDTEPSGLHRQFGAMHDVVLQELVHGKILYECESTTELCKVLHQRANTTSLEPELRIKIWKKVAKRYVLDGDWLQAYRAFSAIKLLLGSRDSRLEKKQLIALMLLGLHVAECDGIDSDNSDWEYGFLQRLCKLQVCPATLLDMKAQWEMVLLASEATRGCELKSQPASISAMIIGDESDIRRCTIELDLFHKQLWLQAVDRTLSPVFAMNAPERWELFVLPEGVKKVDITADTKIPNCVTFAIQKEDHTLGNLLARQMQQREDVVYAGYKMPHPLEHSFVLKVQTKKATTPLAALQAGVDQLIGDLGLLEDRLRNEIRRAKQAGEARRGW